MRPLCGLILLAALAACQQKPADPAVTRAWVRLPAVAGQPGAAYFRLTGGTRDDTLLAVTTPAALKAEMHESAKGDHGMMQMAPLSDVALSAGATVTFAPSGKHVMLYSIGPAVKPGGKIPLELAFAGGKRIQAEAKVVGAGDPPP